MIFSMGWYFALYFAQPTYGTPPGPCNMHSADFIPSRGEVYVFRGGNGELYNIEHILCVVVFLFELLD